MKKSKLKLTLIILSLVSIVAIGQALKEDMSSSVGNGDAMKHNLNEPYIINPAKDNLQGHEVDGLVKGRNTHPEKNLGSDYTRQSYEEKK